MFGRGGGVLYGLMGVLRCLEREVCNFESLDDTGAKEEVAGEGGKQAGLHRVICIASDKDYGGSDSPFAVGGHLMVCIPPIPPMGKEALALLPQDCPDLKLCGHMCKLGVPRDQRACCKCSDDRLPLPTRGVIPGPAVWLAVWVCLIWAGSVPSPECSSHLCGLCRVCERYVQSLSPPQMSGRPGDDDDDNNEEEEEGESARRGQAHWFHLQVHPLTYGLDLCRTCHCDIVMGYDNVLWSCAKSNFDVCTACMSHPAPNDYDRIAGMMVCRSRGRGRGCGRIGQNGGGGMSPISGRIRL